MSNFILSGLYTEGNTDVRFLQAVVKNTIDDIAFECTGDIETELQVIEIETKGLGFDEEIFNASTKAYDLGILILFVHTDADAKDDTGAFKNKINSAKDFLSKQADGCCKNVVAIVPVQMTEAWMLADKDLLKSEIGIDENNAVLGISKNPEEINNPKAVIENIIRLSKENLTKRRRGKGLDISDLYQIMGQKIEISELEKLPSYSKFRNSLKLVLKELNFIHD